MVRSMLLFGAAVVLAGVPVTALGDWADDFDGYEAGTVLYHVGGWSGWDDVESVAGEVSADQSRSAPHSILVDGGADDAIQQFSGYTSGQWVLTAYQYIPSGLDSLTYFIAQNEYNHFGPYEWAMETHMDPALGLVWDQLRDPGLTDAVPLVYDEWVEVRAEIDLDTDHLDHYYNGELISSGLWAVRGGPVEIANLDLYAPHFSPVYYDDISLVPEPASCLLLSLGLVIGLRRR